MKYSKAVYVTKHKIREDQNFVYQLYAKHNKDYKYDRGNNFACQYDSKNEHPMCTCKIPKRQKLRYVYGSQRLSAPRLKGCAYHASSSYTDIGVGSVKALQKRRVRKIYLPETDERGCGSSDLTSFIVRKNRAQVGSYYDYKRTSSKCVGGILEYKMGCVLSQKLSPIYYRKSNTTNTTNFTDQTRTEIGSNTIGSSLVTTGTQFEIGSQKSVTPSIKSPDENSNKIASNKEVEMKTNAQASKVPIKVSEQTPKVKKTSNEQKPKSMEKRTKDAVSSDSLVEHVHNLEDPSYEKQSRTSVDPMENKLEREYRKLFSTKNKESFSKTSVDKPMPEMKSASIVKRRFEALRRGLTKKDEPKKSVSPSSQDSVQSHKDESVSSDPPSLEGRSFTDTKKFTPTQSNAKNTNLTINEPTEETAWPQKDTSSESQGVKGMFKIWGKKFDLDEEQKAKHSQNHNKNALAIDIRTKPHKEKNISEENKKNKKKFFFFKKKPKEKPEVPDEKERERELYQASGVTAGRCELADGLTLKLGQSQPTEQLVMPPSDFYSDSSEGDEIRRRTWLKKFLSNTIESTRSVNVRWNNSMYAASSSTVFELMDTIYNKNTDLVLKSRSDIITDYSYYSRPPKNKVNFDQKIEAWMIPKLITDRPKEAVIKIRSRDGVSINLTSSDPRWVIEKSRAFANKIEVVLRSSNYNRTTNRVSSDYLRIDIPKDFFDISSSDASKQNGTSDEEVFKIVEYESELNTQDLDKGDHAADNINIVVSLQDSQHLETKILTDIETVIKRPPVLRDVVIQGSNVIIPNRCDVIGVGIITQRDLRDIRKPKLKIQDISDNESEDEFHQTNQKKCEFAESYLQEYYRHLQPLGGDLFAWCASDSHLKSGSEKSLASLLDQGDGSKSCPNICDDYKSSAVVSSCNTSSCSQCYEPTGLSNKLMNKLLKPVKAKTDTDVTCSGKRVLPKDSLEVFKRRKIYAAGLKSAWTCSDENPVSVPSIESKGAQNSIFIECPKCSKLDRYLYKPNQNKSNDKHARLKEQPIQVIPPPSTHTESLSDVPQTSVPLSLRESLQNQPPCEPLSHSMSEPRPRTPTSDSSHAKRCLKASLPKNAQGIVSISFKDIPTVASLELRQSSTRQRRSQITTIVVGRSVSRNSSPIATGQPCGAADCDPKKCSPEICQSSLRFKSKSSKVFKTSAKKHNVDEQKQTEFKVTHRSAAPTKEKKQTAFKDLHKPLTTDNLDSAQTEYEEPRTKYRESRTKYEEPRTKYEEQRTEYEEPRTEYQERRMEYEEPRMEYEKPINEYKESTTEYRDSPRNLNDQPYTPDRSRKPTDALKQKREDPLEDALSFVNDRECIVQTCTPQQSASQIKYTEHSERAQTVETASSAAKTHSPCSCKSRTKKTKSRSFFKKSQSRPSPCDCHQEMKLSFKAIPRMPRCSTPPPCKTPPPCRPKPCTPPTCKPKPCTPPTCKPKPCTPPPPCRPAPCKPPPSCKPPSCKPPPCKPPPCKRAPCLPPPCKPPPCKPPPCSPPPCSPPPCSPPPCSPPPCSPPPCSPPPCSPPPCPPKRCCKSMPKLCPPYKCTPRPPILCPMPPCSPPPCRPKPSCSPPPCSPPPCPAKRSCSPPPCSPPPCPRKRSCSPPPCPRKRSCSPPPCPRKRSCSPPPCPRKRSCSPPPCRRKRSCSPPPCTKKRSCSPPPCPRKRSCSPPPCPRKRSCSPPRCDPPPCSPPSCRPKRSCSPPRCDPPPCRPKRSCSRPRCDPPPCSPPPCPRKRSCSPPRCDPPPCSPPPCRPKRSCSPPRCNPPPCPRKRSCSRPICDPPLCPPPPCPRKRSCSPPRCDPPPCSPPPCRRKRSCSPPRCSPPPCPKPRCSPPPCTPPPCPRKRSCSPPRCDPPPCSPPPCRRKRSCSPPRCSPPPCPKPRCSPPPCTPPPCPRKRSCSPPKCPRKRSCSPPRCSPPPCPKPRCSPPPCSPPPCSAPKCPPKQCRKPRCSPPRCSPPPCSPPPCPPPVCTPKRKCCEAPRRSCSPPPCSPPPCPPKRSCSPPPCSPKRSCSPPRCSPPPCSPPPCRPKRSCSPPRCSPKPSCSRPPCPPPNCKLKKRGFCGPPTPCASCVQQYKYTKSLPCSPKPKKKCCCLKKARKCPGTKQKCHCASECSSSPPLAPCCPTPQPRCPSPPRCRSPPRCSPPPCSPPPCPKPRCSPPPCSPPPCRPRSCSPPPCPPKRCAPPRCRSPPRCSPPPCSPPPCPKPRCSPPRCRSPRICVRPVCSAPPVLIRGHPLISPMESCSCTTCPNSSPCRITNSEIESLTQPRFDKCLDCSDGTKYGLYPGPSETNNECPQNCQTEEEFIELNSCENLTIIRKKSSTEVTRDGMNIQVRDYDGHTLYERKDYSIDNEGRRSSLLNEVLYKNSDTHGVSTPLICNMSTQGKDAIVMAQDDSEKSIGNLLEIQFKLRITKGDKTTEIHIGNDGAEPSREINHNNQRDKSKTNIEKVPTGVFLVKNDTKKIAESVEEINPKHDINIKIIVKSYKALSNKDTEVKKNKETFSKKISRKFNTVSTGHNELSTTSTGYNEFNTVSTGYNDLNTVSTGYNELNTVSTEYSDTAINQIDDNVFSIHRTTVDLNSSEETNKTFIKENMDSTEDKKNMEPKDVISSNVYASSMTDASDVEKTLSTKNQDDKNQDDKNQDDKNQDDKNQDDTMCHTSNDKLKHIDKTVNEKQFDTSQEHSHQDFNTSDECSDAQYFAKETQKELLKRVLEKTYRKPKNKENVRQLRDMLKIILTDSSDNEDAGTVRCELVKDVTYKSLEQNYFRNTDSMINYYRTGSSQTIDDFKETVNFQSADENSACSDSDKPECQGCMCTLLAKSLNCNIGNGCCCKQTKINENNSCYLFNEHSDNDSVENNFETQISKQSSPMQVSASRANYLVQYKTEPVREIHKRDSHKSRDILEINTVVSKYADDYTIEYRAEPITIREYYKDRSYEAVVDSSVVSENQIFKQTKSYSVEYKAEPTTIKQLPIDAEINQEKEEGMEISVSNEIDNYNVGYKTEPIIMKESYIEEKHIEETIISKDRRGTRVAKNKTTILGISDDDKIVVLSEQTAKVNTAKRKSKRKHSCNNSTFYKKSDVLQCYAAKKAVLEIYAEKTTSESGEHLVAKLPKFLNEIEKKLTEKLEEITTTCYKSVCSKKLSKLWAKN